MANDFLIDTTYDQEWTEVPTPNRLRRFGLWLFILLFVSVGAVFSLYYCLQSAPTDFPVGVPFTIEPGSGMRTITHELADQHYVKSNWLLTAVLYFYHEPTDIKASTYVFTESQDVYAVAAKLIAGDFGNDLISFTHPEGERASDIAKRAKVVLTDFDEAEFVRLAEPHEGKLFPETYKIPADFTATELYELMLKTYEENVAPLRYRFVEVDLSEKQLLTLASIIEREANSPTSMKMVSGILQNRLRIGMALQTDASIEYILNKPLGELVPADLEIDSPYNTYSHNELPPTPIGNPGLTAITAVIEPTPSKYLYYITGDDGEFHYAEDFETHKANVAKYLK